MDNFKTNCFGCGEEQIIEVRKVDFEKWAKEGWHIQDAMPYVPREKRELLLSGMCPKCWDETFGEDDE